MWRRHTFRTKIPQCDCRYGIIVWPSYLSTVWTCEIVAIAQCNRPLNRQQSASWQSYSLLHEPLLTEVALLKHLSGCYTIRSWFMALWMLIFYVSLHARFLMHIAFEVYEPFEDSHEAVTGSKVCSPNALKMDSKCTRQSASKTVKSPRGPLKVGSFEESGLLTLIAFSISRWRVMCRVSPVLSGTQSGLSSNWNKTDSAIVSIKGIDYMPWKVWPITFWLALCIFLMHVCHQVSNRSMSGQQKDLRNLFGERAITDTKNKVGIWRMKKEIQ